MIIFSGFESLYFLLEFKGLNSRIAIRGMPKIPAYACQFNAVGGCATRHLVSICADLILKSILMEEYGRSCFAGLHG